MKFSKMLNARRIVALMLVLLMVVGLMPSNLFTAKAATNIASANVACGDVIASVETVTFTACQDLTKNDKGSATTIGEQSYDYTLKTSGKNNVAIGEKTARALGVLTTTADAKVSISVYMGSGKSGYIFESDSALEVDNTSYGNAADAKTVLDVENAVVTLAEGSNAYEFTAEAGKYYYLAGQGTNLELWDVQYLGASNDAPQMGKKYSINFAELSEAGKLNGYTTGNGVFKVVSEADKAYFHDGQHGAALYPNDKIEVKVAGSAVLSLTLCQYGNASAYVVYDAAGNKVGQTSGKATTDGTVETVAYDGAATTLTIAFEGAGEGYLHAIDVENLEQSGNAEDFTFIYDEMAVDGVVKTGEYKFGDSVLLLGGETVSGVITQYTVKNDKKVPVVGVSHDSYTSGKRHADSNNILTLPGEGDGCLTVFTPAAKGMMTVYFNSTSFLRVHDFNNDGTKNGFVDSPTSITEYSFVVVPGHTYVMSTTGKTNNMFYAGYKYVVDKKVEVPVTVTNIDAVVGDSLKIELVDDQLGGDPIAVKDGATLKLLSGHTYRVSSNDGGVKPLIGESETFTVTGDAVTVSLYNVPDVTLTGKITGTDASNVSKLFFTNNANGLVYEATITGDSYSVSLKPGEYKASVETTNGGVTFDRASVKADVENVDEVYVEVADPSSKRTYAYDAIPTLETTGSVAVETGKTHTVGRAESTIKIPVSGKAKVVVNAYYAADFTINGVQKVCDSATTSKIDTYEEIVDGDVTIAFNATSYLTGISVIPLVEFKSELTVPGDYKSLNEASAAILGMMDRPEGEAGRVTINLVDDVFEQTVIDAPYVTLKGNGHTIAWYYGVGTYYYSIEKSTGLYSERLARDKYSYAEGDGNLWGGVFIVRGDNFIAEDTVFLNTYNYYLTDVEKSDIAGTALAVNRLAEGANVAEYAFKERSNAFYIAANNIEVYNCQILSSQDTLGRNGSANNGYHTYFKDCVIGGNVDYICGEFAAVFDNCELQWKTYANDTKGNNAKIGYIVAPKTSPYVFRDCTVTTDVEVAEGTVLGKFGRTWGANSNSSFIGVETNGLIDGEGWGEMGSGEKASAIFNEYNNTNKGEAFGTSAYTNNTLEAVVDYIDTAENCAIDTVLAGWIPVHYTFLEQDYTIIEGADSTVEEGNDLVVKSDASFGKFVMVLVDGIEVDPANYEAVEGSTVVTLKAAFVDTLTAGEHVITVVSRDGSAESKFTVTKKAAPVDPNPSKPATGDAAPILPLGILMMASMAAIVVTGKKRANR